MVAFPCNMLDKLRELGKLHAEFNELYKFSDEYDELSNLSRTISSMSRIKCMLS